MAKIFLNDESVIVSNRLRSGADEVDLTEERLDQLAAMKSRWPWLEEYDYVQINKSKEKKSRQLLLFEATDSSPELEALIIADGRLPSGWSVGTAAQPWVIDFLTDLLRTFGDSFEVCGSVEFSDQYGESLDTGWKARLDDQGNLDIRWYGGDKEVWEG